MAKYSKTDSGAFNSIRFGKVNFAKEAEKSRKEVAHMRAERLAAMKAYIKADDKKLIEAEKRTAARKAKENEVKFSGAFKFLESRKEANAL